MKRFSITASDVEPALNDERAFQTSDLSFERAYQTTDTFAPVPQIAPEVSPLAG